MPQYDTSDNQTSIKTATDGSTVVECGYDYQGRRYMKNVTVNSTVVSHERYLYRSYLQLAALDMLNGRNVLCTLLWDPLEEVATRPLALVWNNALYCYGWDFNKNVTEVFNREGAIAVAYDYSPYGTVTKTGNLVQPLQWSSEMNDEELELVYYNYRYYNPADGRWINRDPIAEEGGWNLYAFIGNNSIKKKDIVGLISDSVTDTIIAYGAQGMSPKAISDLLGISLAIVCAVLKQPCPPCPPPKGKSGTRIDYVPPSRSHHPCPGNHRHRWKFEMHQDPKTCKCYEKKVESPVECL